MTSYYVSNLAYSNIKTIYMHIFLETAMNEKRNELHHFNRTWNLIESRNPMFGFATQKWWSLQIMVVPKMTKNQVITDIPQIQIDGIFDGIFDSSPTQVGGKSEIVNLLFRLHHRSCWRFFGKPYKVS